MRVLGWASVAVAGTVVAVVSFWQSQRHGVVGNLHVAHLAGAVQTRDAASQRRPYRDLAQVPDLDTHNRVLSTLCGRAQAPGDPNADGGNRCIFLTLAGVSTDRMSPVALCSLESICTHNADDWNVVVVVVNGTVDVSEFSALNDLHNLHVVHTTAQFVLAPSPQLARWYADPGFHTVTDVLGAQRLALLHRWGGWFLDMDMLALRPLARVRANNSFGVQSGEPPTPLTLATVNATGVPMHIDTNNAALAMTAGGGLVRTCMSEFVDGFDPHKWGIQGPDMLRRALLRLLRKHPAGIPADVFSGLQPSSTFYPVPWQRFELLTHTVGRADTLRANLSRAQLAERWADWDAAHEQPVLLHLWSAMPKASRPYTASSLMAAAFNAACPRTAASCLDEGASAMTAANSTAMMCDLQASFYAASGFDKLGGLVHGALDVLLGHDDPA